jgi:putative membrane protein
MAHIPGRRLRRAACRARVQCRLVRPAQILLNLVRGFIMGSADVVPGVSGGTIAVLVGIYERLVHAISMASKALGNVLRLRFRDAGQRLREIEWGLIIPLLVGIGLAIFTLAGVISHLLDTQPEAMAGLFIGLVAASAWVAWRMIKAPSGVSVIIAVAVAVAFFLLLGLKGGAVTDPSWLVIFGAGAIAICAMILPGVSGSFLLLMLGMYDFIISAVNERDFPVLGVFALGCLIGIALFSQVLDWALGTYHDLVVAAMVGLLIGSFRVLWPWPGGVDSTELGGPTGTWYVPVLLAVAAAAVVVIITLVVDRRSRDGGSSVPPHPR